MSSQSSSAILIGCVGKPSSGKSTFLNAATGAHAKMGDYPFTTIDPNVGIAWLAADCPCVETGVKCNPKYGSCDNGKRKIPIQMMDVAGLVPGASEGRGLGNTFLDDLRHAHVFLHVLDASGQTDAEGKKTQGYDPVQDVEWLFSEIHAWICNNLLTKWSSITRRHVAASCENSETIGRQLSGYGARELHILKTFDLVPDLRELPLQDWQVPNDVKKFVDAFLPVRFPHVLVLNKADQPDAARNIERICRRYPRAITVPCSALAEVFLRQMAKKGSIIYNSGDDDFEIGDGVDEKSMARLQHIRDMIIFRYGGTGVQDAVNGAVSALGYTAVFPVRSLVNFGDGKGNGAFRDCMLMPPQAKISDLLVKIGGSEPQMVGVEGRDGCRLSEDELVEEHRIVRIVYL